MSRAGSIAENLEKGLALAIFWVVFLVLVDVGFRVILNATHDFEGREVAVIEDQRVKAAPYRDAPFDVDAFFAEMRAARKEAYTPYVVWRSRPFDGEFIDIDDEGNRSTYQAGDIDATNSINETDPLRIWLFGGSVIWGLGAPDSLTVSSHLVRHFENEFGTNVVVRNLGEIGFVNTQEVVLLIRELQLGRRPDLVVFFDGVNDAPVAVLWPEVDGNHMNFTAIRDRFEKREKVEPHPMLRLLRRSGMWRMADALGKRFEIQRTQEVVAPYSIPKDSAEIRLRGERAAEVWLDNRRFVEALGSRYGFVPFYLLQPSLKVGAKSQHPSEVSLLETEMENDAKRVGMESYAAMREAVRRRPQTSSEVERRTLDLSDVFAGVSEPLYFDYVHVGHEGNRLIASAVADVLHRYHCGDEQGAAPNLHSLRVVEMCQ